MATLQTFEDKAVAEFGWLVGQVAAHPKTTVVVGLLGWVLFVWKLL